MSRVIYFSSFTGNTHKFVGNLEVEAARIPLRASDPAVMADEPYILIVPAYGEGVDTKAVPKQVITFLKSEINQRMLRGVIAGGNRNFGKDFCLAGRQIARRFSVPLLHQFEISGLAEDVQAAQRHIKEMDHHL
jgi:protein involved in ribonucleotide reduction